MGISLRGNDDNKQSHSLSIVTNCSEILGLLRQVFFFFFFLFCRNVLFFSWLRQKSLAKSARSLPLTRSVTSVLLYSSGWVLQLSLFWRNAAIPFLFRGSRRGPGTAKPGKSSTDLCNDSISRFLARVHSYVINRSRSKTIKRPEHGWFRRCSNRTSIRQIWWNILLIFARENRKKKNERNDELQRVRKVQMHVSKFERKKLFFANWSKMWCIVKNQRGDLF